MFERLRTITIALAVALASGGIMRAQTPAPPKAATTYDVAFTFGDTTYSGTMKLTFDHGSIAGTMTITAPVPVSATVAGKQKGAALTFDYPYSMGGDQPCDGHVTIDATMDSKTGSATGTAHSVGCGDPADGTFSLKRPADRE